MAPCVRPRRSRQQAEPRRRQRARLFDDGRQRLAAGAFGDSAVQAMMQREIRTAILLRDSASTFAAILIRPARSRLRRVVGKAPRGLGLENFAHQVVALDVLARRNPHARAGARTALEHAFELEPQQRLRHRQKAHAELGGEFSPRDGLADRHLAADDAAADEGVGFGGEAGAICRQSSRPRRCCRSLCTSRPADTGTADACDRPRRALVCDATIIAGALPFSTHCSSVPILSKSFGPSPPPQCAMPGAMNRRKRRVTSRAAGAPSRPGRSTTSR